MLTDNHYSHEFIIYEHDIGGEWYISIVHISDVVGNAFSEQFTPDQSPNLCFFQFFLSGIGDLFWG